MFEPPPARRPSFARRGCEGGEESPNRPEKLKFEIQFQIIFKANEYKYS